jgi:DNA-binding transcriptional ArsR family regulator
MDQEFAATANLLAEPTRAVMLLKLLSGGALAAGELAACANISPQTASGHLAKLTEARLIEVEIQGRHRYYRLASTEVAHALEAMLVLLPGNRKDRTRPSPPEVGTIAYARTCYSHLAGWLGVRIVDALQANGFLSPRENKAFFVTEAGRVWFDKLGVPVTRHQAIADAKGARQCLDWTERRPHLAGALGVALYRRFLDLGWLAPISRSRAVRVTLRGKKELWNQLHVTCGE